MKVVVLLNTTMVRPMTLSNVFLTGCDQNTQWMLPWFVSEYKKHNITPLIFADFGISKSLLQTAKDKKWFHEILPLHSDMSEGWFKKPKAMNKCGEKYKNTCWLDTDCQVVGNISGIFGHIEPGKLSMAEDKPWSKRRGETWHNSGVVAFTGVPYILKQWMKLVRERPTVGDQETLHMMIPNPIMRMSMILDLPNEYNVLRIQHDDGTVPNNPLIYHWTGKRGKDYIRGLINE